MSSKRGRRWGHGAWSTGRVFLADQNPRSFLSFRTSLRGDPRLPEASSDVLLKARPETSLPETSRSLFSPLHVRSAQGKVRFPPKFGAHLREVLLHQNAMSLIKKIAFVGLQVVHGWKDGEDSEDENQELVQIDRERRRQATGRLRAGSRAGTASTGHDRPSSEEELESIIVARDCGLPGEKRKWCQVTGGGRTAPCGCGERASSSDEEVRDLCCSKAFRPIQQNGQDCGSPVLFGASPPRCLQSTARCPRGRLPCSAFEHASPCKRHKQIFADGGRRPSLDFEKMQQSRREAVVLSLRKRINGILMELEEKPDDSMEVETTVECALTNDDLQRLKDFTERLERILADVISSCTALRTRLHVLWRQLDVGEDERASIAAPTAGTTERVHQLLVDEFGRLAEMRRARLGDVISRVKEGIVLEWERCCYGDSQKQAFVPFHDGSPLQAEISRSRPLPIN
uniref:uncharacterized protein isoform X2 n=1 Tax=Myxine glutinosa TaxID=7769 RepID=UPI00358EDFB5